MTKYTTSLGPQTTSTIVNTGTVAVKCSSLKAFTDFARGGRRPILPRVPHGDWTPYRRYKKASGRIDGHNDEMLLCSDLRKDQILTRITKTVL